MKFEFIRSGKAVNIEGARLLKGDFFVEEKFDGSRYGAELTEDGWKLYSRNGIDRAENVPYITEALNTFDWPIGTVLDGEIITPFAPREKRWELSRSVMGTKHYNPDTPKAHYVIFDIQHFGNGDMKSKK
jgi:ATP-dependent DNA ligase